MGLSVGGSKGSSKSKTNSTETTSLDAATSALQTGNYARAQGLAETPYHTLDASQIQAQMNPYDQAVVDTTQADLERQREMAVNATGDAAAAAGAFGGSRHGVAEAQTNEAALRNAGGILAQLRQQGFAGAQAVAANENASANQFPLLLQQVLNQSLSGVQGAQTTVGNSKSKGQTTQFSAAASYGGK
jgi:hypothetical protein